MENLNFKREEKFYDFTFKNALVVFLIFSIVAILIDLKYRYLFWFNSSFYMLLLIFFSPVVIIISASLESMITDRINVSKFMILIPFICVSGIFGGKYVSKYQADLSKEGVEKIITAIEKYKIDNDKYPKELIQLVPKYLENVPNSKMGWFDIPYDYQLSAELSYIIKFPSDEEAAWLFYRNSKGWREVQD